MNLSMTWPAMVPKLLQVISREGFTCAEAWKISLNKPSWQARARGDMFKSGQNQISDGWPPAHRL